MQLNLIDYKDLTGPTRGGFRGYIVPGPWGARKSSCVHIKFWCRTQWLIYGTKFE